MIEEFNAYLCVIFFLLLADWWFSNVCLAKNRLCVCFVNGCQSLFACFSAFSLHSHSQRTVLMVVLMMMVMMM